MTVQVEDTRLTAMRMAMTELIAGYSEVGRLLSSFPAEWRETLLAPLRDAAESAAAVLARS